MKDSFNMEEFIEYMRGGTYRTPWDFLTQYFELFSDTRRFNALVSSCIVSLCQQLSGSKLSIKTID
jgi:hypothetical protein